MLGSGNFQAGAGYLESITATLTDRNVNSWMEQFDFLDPVGEIFAWVSCPTDMHWEGQVLRTSMRRSGMQCHSVFDALGVDFKRRAVHHVEKALSSKAAEVRNIW